VPFVTGLFTFFLTRGRHRRELQPRDGFLLVSLVWSVVPAFATIPLILQWDENLDVGSDTGTPVDDRDYEVPFPFTGKIGKITLTIDRPKLSPADVKRLEAAQRSNRTSE